MPYKRKFVATYKPTTLLRPPDWRWHRVCEIVDEGSYATKRYDGEIICRIVKFVRKMQRLRTDRGIRDLARRCPDIHFAIRLSQESGLRPLELHARVLARQSDLQIARQVGLPTATIQTYIDLFFDVRSRLNARPWINFCVAGIDPRYPPSPQSLLLLNAYLRGPLTIGPWIDYLAHQGELHELNTEEGRRRAGIELLIDIHHLPETENFKVSTMRICDLIAEMDTKPAHDATVAGAVSRNLHRLVADFDWRRQVDAASTDTGHVPVSDRQVQIQQNRETAMAG